MQFPNTEQPSLVLDHDTIMHMAEDIRAISWEAPEHHHIEKSGDWYWALGIIAVAGAAAMLVFNNTLFAFVILLGAITMVLVALRPPRLLPFAVMTRGIRIGNDLYTYSNLESFRIDEDAPHGPQLLIKSNRLFAPLIIMPLPEEYIDDIEALLLPRLKEEHLEEPLSHRLLEFLGF